MENNLIFTTSDFYSACVLRAKNIPLDSLTKERGNYITFSFDASPEICEGVLKEHWDRTLLLESRLLIETINELKTRVHDKMKEGYSNA